MDEKEESREVRLFGGSRFGKWLENLWYHEKFWIIAAILLLVAGIICFSQCAAKGGEEIDFTLCYAGACDLRPSASNTRARDIGASVQGIAKEAGLGEGIAVNHYLINFSAEDAAAVNLTRTNLENLQNELNTASGFLFLLDGDLFDRYAHSADGTSYMVPVSEYLPEGSSARVTPDGYGVYLRSTRLASLPGFSDLPEDTVLSLRIKFAVSGAFSSGAKRDAAYRAYEDLFRALLGN